MKKIKYLSSLVFLFTTVLAACQKEVIKPNKEASEYFPNKVGNYWEYVVYDSSEARGIPYSNYSRNYTVKINITGIKKLADGIDAAVWVYEYPWGNDTNYVRITQDTVKVFDKSRTETIYGLKFPLKIFLLPFQDGQQWDGKLLWIDKYTSNSVSNIISNGNTFTDSFLIFHHNEGPNIECNDYYWFKPKIGLIKKNEHQYNLGPLNIQSWQLKTYYLQ
jgi:hypothetical protein